MSKDRNQQFARCTNAKSKDLFKQLNRFPFFFSMLLERKVPEQVMTELSDNGHTAVPAEQDCIICRHEDITKESRIIHTISLVESDMTVVMYESMGAHYDPKEGYVGILTTREFIEYLNSIPCIEKKLLSNSEIMWGIRTGKVEEEVVTV